MTMSVVTYERYLTEYGGDLTEVAFSSAVPAATRHVAWVCGGKLPVGDTEEAAYVRAVCAAAEAFASYGEGQVGGFSIGDFKMTHYEDEGTTGAEIATDAIIKELSGTSLLFCGVR